LSIARSLSRSLPPSASLLSVRRDSSRSTRASDLSSFDVSHLLIPQFYHHGRRA
jgi:hypothetical protein